MDNNFKTGKKGEMMKRNFLVGLAVGLFMFGVVGLAGATNISMLASEWSIYNGSGVISQNSDGVMLSGIGYRTGAFMRSNGSIDLSDAEVFIKWKVDGPNNYMGTGVGTGYFVGGSYTTDHSWDGSLVIPQNTWLFTHINYNPNMSYSTIISTGNYDTFGGTILHSTSSTFSSSQFLATV